MKLKSTPEPISVDGIVTSAAAPEILKSPDVISVDGIVASAAPMKAKSDPEPIYLKLNLVVLAASPVNCMSPNGTS